MTSEMKALAIAGQLSTQHRNPSPHQTIGARFHVSFPDDTSYGFTWGGPDRGYLPEDAVLVKMPESLHPKTLIFPEGEPSKSLGDFGTLHFERGNLRKECLPDSVVTEAIVYFAGYEPPLSAPEGDFCPHLFGHYDVVEAPDGEPINKVCSAFCNGNGNWFKEHTTFMIHPQKIFEEKLTATVRSPEGTTKRAQLNIDAVVLARTVAVDDDKKIAKEVELCVEFCCQLQNKESNLLVRISHQLNAKMFAVDAAGLCVHTDPCLFCQRLYIKAMFQLQLSEDTIINITVSISKYGQDLKKLIAKQLGQQDVDADFVLQDSKRFFWNNAVVTEGLIWANLFSSYQGLLRLTIQ